MAMVSKYMSTVSALTMMRDARRTWIPRRSSKKTRIRGRRKELKKQKERLKGLLTDRQWVADLSQSHRVYKDKI